MSISTGQRKYGTIKNDTVTCPKCGGSNTRYLREVGNVLRYFCDDCNEGFDVRNK
jgi:transposase-like protein